MSSEETALWAWLLFESGLGRAKAKSLLGSLNGRPLRALLREVTADPSSWGLTRAEAARLHPPVTLPAPTAVRWDEATYPDGLQALPPEKRPALLFYRGNAALLSGHLFLFTDAPPVDEAMMEEAIALLLGEVRLAAPLGSAAAEVLVSEMASTGGEALFFVRQGLDEEVLSPQVEALVEAGRLLLVSFLPPGTPFDPRWRALLAETEAAVAERVIHCGALPPDFALPARRRWLWLVAQAPSRVPPAVEVCEDAALLLASLPARHLPAAPPPVTPAEERSPLSPEEALALLGRGGRVPEKLRRRLLGERDEPRRR